MNTNTNVEETVIRLFREMGLAESEQVTMETKLADHIDSLEMIEFVMSIEDEYEKEVSDEVAEGWTTLQDVVNTVKAFK